MEQNMYVFCKYTDREILQMLSKNINRKKEDFNLELKVHSGLNGDIGMVATWWDLILFEK